MPGIGSLDRLYQARERRYNHVSGRPGGTMSRSQFAFTLTLAVVVFLPACTQKRPLQPPPSPLQNLSRRAEDPGEREGHGPRQSAAHLTRETADALAAVPTQLSLGEWRPVGPWTYAGKAFDVAVSPSDPNTVFAAFGLAGVYSKAGKDTCKYSCFMRFRRAAAYYPRWVLQSCSSPSDSARAC